VEDHWRVNGRHYQQTNEDWLKLQDAHRDEIMPNLQEVYGSEAHIWFQRWRVFFMACAELFGYNGGNECMYRELSAQKSFMLTGTKFICKGAE